MSDAINTAEAANTPLAVDPFGSFPSWASRVTGLGGSEPAADPEYVFMTLFCRPALGRVRALVTFHDLVASHGTLQLTIHVKSAFPDAEAWRLHNVTVDLADLAASGGICEIAFDSFRNSLYAVSGEIATDGHVSAAHLSVSLDRRASPDEHGRPWGWRLRVQSRKTVRGSVNLPVIQRQLSDQNIPDLECPVSQVGVPSQCLHPSFGTIAQALGLPLRATPEAWAQAYVVRVIEAHTQRHSATRMLAYPTQDTVALVSYFASQGIEILSVGHKPLVAGRPDPGDELHNLHRPAICDEAEFFAHAHLTFGDIRLPPPSLHDQFDVVWSIGANRQMSRREFADFVVNGLICAKPGGLAVHVFDYIDDVDAEGPDVLTRHDIERMTVMALSHHNDVAPLRFNAAIDQRATLPFGLIVRRGL